ncbi:MAG: ribulose-phosphate 3-epimerase [Pyrinomonadaceae bacterium]
MFEIAPSILSADFTRLGEEIRAVEEGGANIIHFDVMDGRFVPNITIGLPVLRSVRKATKLKIDCHLMIENPSRYAVQFVEAGADMVSVHIEADVHLQRTLTAIREAGGRAGVAVNPATSLSNLDEALPFADFIVLMSVNPGFGGQKFISTALDKLRRLREMIELRNLKTRIEIDGGVDAGNIKKVVEAGAEIIVAGSAVFGNKNPAQAVRDLIEAGTDWM